MALLLLTLPFLALGLVTGRVAAAVAAPLIVTTWYVGLAEGWWGDGVGDGWEAALVVSAVVATIQTLVGVALHRLIVRRLGV